MRMRGGSTGGSVKGEYTPCCSPRGGGGTRGTMIHTIETPCHTIYHTHTGHFPPPHTTLRHTTTGIWVYMNVMSLHPHTA